jgi:hypothetical protein
MAIVAMLVASAACGGRAPQAASAKATARPETATDRILPLLPTGAQVVVELDLARLRHNETVGAVARRALERLGGDQHVPGLPFRVQGSPIAEADAVVLATYGLGTDQATTVVVLATHAEVAGGARVSPEIVVLAPETWVGQIQTRVALDATTPLTAPAELLALRAHAMPPGASGAILRVTARLPFDARVALAREAGLEMAPAQLSVWADIADDLAIIVDADAADPGDRVGKDAARRLARALRHAFGSIAEDAVVRALGVPNSFDEAHFVSEGTWVRAIVAIGPRHLARAVERANALLQGAAS